MPGVARRASRRAPECFRHARSANAGAGRLWHPRFGCAELLPPTARRRPSRAKASAFTELNWVDSVCTCCKLACSRAHHAPLPAAAMSPPSGEMATDNICPEGLLSVPNACPVAAFQTWTVPSTLPETMVLPSGEYATDVTASLCPLRICIKPPVPRFQILTVASALPAAIWVPSGETASDNTAGRTSHP